jgi:hypothetical protein
MYHYCGLFGLTKADGSKVTVSCAGYALDHRSNGVKIKEEGVGKDTERSYSACLREISQNVSKEVIRGIIGYVNRFVNKLLPQNPSTAQRQLPRTRKQSE